MQLPDSVARFNRHVTNPIQRIWADKLPGFGIIEHVGRRSGKAYRTPVNVFGTPDGFAVFLTYGPDRDWVRNLKAAGGGKVVHRGRTYEVTDPKVVPMDDVRKLVSKWAVKLSLRLNLDYGLLLTTLVPTTE